MGSHNKEDAAQLIQRLAECGIDFTATHDSPDGKATVTLTPAMVEVYLIDSASAFAQAYGVSRVDYLEWHRAGYAVQCAEVTSKGRRCRNKVLGGHLVSTPDRWVALKGAFCQVHEEGSML